MGAGGGAAAAAAAIANAIKASGAIVEVKLEEFLKILSLLEEPLVVMCEKKIFKSSFQYMISYKGFVFHTKSKEHLPEINSARVIMAKNIWVPF
jgi:hypothetical protein